MGIALIVAKRLRSLAQFSSKNAGHVTTSVKLQGTAASPSVPMNSRRRMWLAMSKQDPMKRGRDLITAVVEEDAKLILGDSTWSSAPGIEQMLNECPVRICFIDEVGDELMKINSQVGNQFVAAVSGLLKKAYNSRDQIRTGRTKHMPGVVINDPALSLVMAATPEKFWGGLAGGDLESGVVNRFIILPVTEDKTLRPNLLQYQDTLPPSWLVEELRKLPRGRIGFVDQTGDEEVKWASVEDWQHQRWESDEVADIWQAAAVAFKTEENKKKLLVGKRGGENGIRMSQIVAAGCFRDNLCTQNVGWGLAVAKQGIEVAYAGAKQFLHTYLYFPEMCEELHEHIIASGGFASRRQLLRELGRKDRYGNGLLDRAINQLQLEGRISGLESKSTGGRPKEGYRLVTKEEE